MASRPARRAAAPSASSSGSRELRAHGWRGVVALFLVGAALLNWWGWTLVYSSPIFAAQSFMFRLKFLTNVNMLINTAFYTLEALFAVAQLARVVAPASKAARGISALFDGFFFSYLVPGAMVVAVIFWSLYFVNRELIFPARLDGIYPPYLNVQQHALIEAVVLVDWLVFRRRRGVHLRGRTLALLASIVPVGYGLRIAVPVLTAGEWPYPFLQHFVPPFAVLVLLPLTVGLAIGIQRLVTPRPRRAPASASPADAPVVPAAH